MQVKSRIFRAAARPLFFRQSQLDARLLFLQAGHCIGVQRASASPKGLPMQLVNQILAICMGTSYFRPRSVASRTYLVVICQTPLPHKWANSIPLRRQCRMVIGDPLLIAERGLGRSETPCGGPTDWRAVPLHSRPDPPSVRGSRF